MFDIGKWVAQFLFTQAEYDRLHAFVNDSEAYAEHTKKLTLRTADDEGNLIEDKDKTSLRRMHLYAKQEIDEALNSYSRQMVVVLSTYLESMIADFFENVFINKPESMYDYIHMDGDIKQKGYIKITEVVNSKDKEEIIRNLASRASKFASNGSLENISNRVTKLSKEAFDMKLVNWLQRELLNVRHEIIHDDKRIAIQNKAIKIIIENMEKYLLTLGKATKKMDLPYDDPLDWLN